MQPATQGPSTSGLHPDHEAMKSAQSAAIVANEKAFPVFAKRLASKDPKDFTGTARKLAVWLSSEKAYYLAARPKIVELLEIALSAFVDTFAHHQAFAEFAEQLRLLVQAVIPFKKQFLENELQARLQRVIMDTERSLSTVAQRITRSNRPPQGMPTANSPSLTSIPPVDVQSQPVIASAVPPVHSPSKPISPFQSTPSLTLTLRAASDSSIRLETRDTTEVASGQTDTGPPLASPVMNTPQEQGGSSSTAIPFRPQPKRARRAELSEALVARDLDWFKTYQASAPGNEDTSKAGERSASDAPHVPGQSPSLKKKTFRMVPSRRLPRRIVQTAESGTSPPREPSAEGTRSNAEVIPAHDIMEQLSLVGVQSDARSVATTEAHDTQQISPLPVPQRLATSLNGTPIQPAIPQMDQRSPSTQAPFPNGDSAPFPVSSIPPPVTGTDVSVLDSSSEVPLSEARRYPESTPPQSPQALQLESPILPPLVSAWEPPLDLTFNISQIPSGHAEQSAMDADRRRFDGEMTVILSTQGKPFTYSHGIDLTLEEGVFAKISKWINRRSHPSEASQGVCMSLGCYRIPEFFEKASVESGKLDMETLVSQSSCSWPRSNRLSLYVDDRTRDTMITLSPPLFLTPDQCVDVSSLMKLGNNTLEIKQRGDMSEYLIVLHAHHPTRAQLAELEVVKTADERWRRFLDVLSARVVPGKVLGTMPAGVVGVF